MKVSVDGTLHYQLIGAWVWRVLDGGFVEIIVLMVMYVGAQLHYIWE